MKFGRSFTDVFRNKCT